ncbi:unnamed protein product [Fraxinus pennsylvanica]|uniref:Uncharacterized protein n=1 Tax=Fraxinus pennsylvanica TaxID=56036 RepID=A0AAD2DZ12_9LAMI|nr:unnamed protein product [Fraxinus pennsylvanica]
MRRGTMEGPIKLTQQSIVEEDLDEFNARIVLGFRFNSSKMEKRLLNTLSTYGFYYSISNHYNNIVSKYHLYHLHQLLCEEVKVVASDSGAATRTWGLGENGVTASTISGWVWNRVGVKYT